MQRRIFLGLSAISALTIGPLLDSCGTKSINPALAQPPFLSQLLDAKSMVEAGRAYLKKTPIENDKNKLTELLLMDSPISNSSESSLVHSFFDRKILDDFEKARIVSAKGWILSVTEARQCALFSIIHL